MPKRICKNCGHSWIWHHDYNDELERYTDHDCEYWDGCECKHYVEETVDNA